MVVSDVRKRHQEQQLYDSEFESSPTATCCVQSAEIYEVISYEIPGSSDSCVVHRRVPFHRYRQQPMSSYCIHCTKRVGAG